MRKFYILLSLLTSTIWVQSQTQKITFDQAGNHSFTVPCGVYSITVEAWGGGGAGGGATANGAKAGGGSGGAYTKGTFNVTPNQTINLSVGNGGTGSTSTTPGMGEDSWAFAKTVLLAKGGNGANRVNSNTTGGGATAVNSGNENTGISVTNIYGSAGAHATTGASGSGGKGGNGGVGGAAVGSNTAGNQGTAPGGGGSGGFRNSSTSRKGGSGGDGLVVISYNGLPATYCPVDFIKESGWWGTNFVRPITYVEFAGISNRTSASTDAEGYEKFCDKLGQVNTGGSYSIKLEGNTDDLKWGPFWITNHHDYYTVFFDWNQNGTFELNERYQIPGNITHSDGNDGNFITGNILIPSDALLGKTVMRVIKNEGSLDNDPCGNKYQFGQAEDYIIEVSGSCKQPTMATANTSPSLTLCEGNEATLRQSGGQLGPNQVWKWYINAPSGTLVGQTSNSDASIVVSPTTTTTYYVRAEGGNCGTNGTGKTVTVTVTKKAMISLFSGNQDAVVCKSTPITKIVFAVAGGGTGASITSGTLPSGLSGSFSNGKFTISGTPTQVGTFNYTVTPTGNAPCTNVGISGVITILETLSGFTYSNSNANYCLGGTITTNLPLFATGAATSFSVLPSLPNGLNLNTATGEITGSPTITQGVQNYTITASNGSCSVATTIKISISSTGAQSFNLSPAGISQICSVGGSVNITLSNSENGKQYQVYRDGAPVGAPVNGSGSQLDFGTFAISGSYIVKTTDACATQMNGVATIQVTPKPNVTFSYTESMFCTNMGTSGEPTFSGSPKTGVFTASPAGLVFMDNATGEIDLASSSAGVYTITYTIAPSGGCSVYSTASTIQIINAPSVFTVTGGGAYCAGGVGKKIGITGSQSGVKYQLYRNEIAVGAPITGDGSAIDFGVQAIAGEYTVATIGSGCEVDMDGTATITINPLPANILISPASATVCQGVILPLTASENPPQTSTGSVSFSSGTIDIPIPDNSMTGVYIPLSVVGIPEGAIISEVSINFNITHTYDGDLLLNLKGPNGKVLNIANGIGGSGNNYSNTVVTSDISQNPISSANAPFSGTYRANAIQGVAGAALVPGNTSNASVFSDLYLGAGSGANGTWVLSARDKGNKDVGTLKDWSITVKYTYVSNKRNVSWGPSSNLYTDPGATIPYAGESIEKVYLKASTSGSKQYTATSTNEAGCSTTATTSIMVNPSPVLTLIADYCSDIQNNLIKITANSSLNVKNWIWSSGYDQGPTSASQSSVIKTKTAGTFYVSAVSTSNNCPATGTISVAQELVVNGDFEQGNSGFESDYTFVGTPYSGGATGLWPEGTYAVSNDPHEYHSNFWGTDHTTANGEGKFMLINGIGQQNKVIWRQYVNVIPNTDYYFSAFAVSLNEGSPFANLVFRVNGVQVGTNTGALPSKPTGTNEPGTWKRFYSDVKWNSGGNTTAKIEIVNLQTAAGGNDFGLDDISFGTQTTFFNQTGDQSAVNQTLCLNTPINTISFEAGGDGTEPSLTWSATTPAGIEHYWNGRDYTLKGNPSTSGVFNYNLKLPVCNGKFLTKTGVVKVNPSSFVGDFKNSIGNAIPICYNSSGIVELENTQGNILKWETSTDNINWTNVTNTTTKWSYSNFQDPMFVRAYAKQVGTGCTEDVSAPIRLGLRNLWEGNNNDDWSDAGNWSFSTLPTPGCDYVIIPQVGTKPYPKLLSSSVQVNNLIVRNNASLTIGNTGKLKVSGKIFNESNGAIDATAGSVEFNGNSLQAISSSIFKDTTIKNLVVSNDAGLNVASTGNSLAITGMISFGSANGKLNSGDNITLKSTATGTANLGEVGTNNTVTGKFTVERYINIGTDAGQHAKAWLFLATPTGRSGLGQTIKQSWMENSSGTASTGFGIQIPNNVGSGWDPGTVYAPSIKYYDTNTGGYVSKNSSNGPLSSGDALYNEAGWMVFVRGDRSATGSASPPTNTNLRSKGEVTTGTVVFNVPAKVDGYKSFGNPYASSVDMMKVKDQDNGDKPPVNFQIWDPSLTQTGPEGNSSYGLGGYRSATLDEDETGYTMVPDVGYPEPNILRSGQAFFVQTGASPYTLTFNENSKTALGGNHESFRTVNQRGAKGTTGTLSSTLFNSLGTVIDGTLQFFNNKYSNDLDMKDGFKMMNSGINLAIKKENKLLVVERKESIHETDTIFFNLTGVAVGKYDFKFKAKNLSAPGLEGWIEDAFTQQRTPLNLEGETTVNFEVSNTAASKAANRFRIVFKEVARGPLPVTFTNLQALYEGGLVHVKWSVENESNLSKYVVMKSTDGTNFSDLADVVAGGLTHYNAIDRNAANGYDYYRIRSVDKDGRQAYSDIVKVWIGNAQPLITVFPNPIVNGVINLKLENMPKGKYQVRLLNPGGQVMQTNVFDHAGGNYTEKIPWDYKMAHGHYKLEVKQPDGGMRIITVMY